MLWMAAREGEPEWLAPSAQAELLAPYGIHLVGHLARRHGATGPFDVLDHDLLAQALRHLVQDRSLEDLY